MKLIFNAIKAVINVVALLVFASGLVLAILGAIDFAKVFFLIGSADPATLRGLMAIGLLHAVDSFLVAIVFFVLSLGFLILFNDPEAQLPIKLPPWLHVHNFMELKGILWEAILTTLVVSHLARLAERIIEGQDLTYRSLIIPGGIFLIALSLFFLKRAEKK
jgi:uncharacterized membrane protein YqhA